MRLDGLRMLVFLAASALYLYWLGVPVMRWLTPGNLDGSGWGALTAVLIVVVIAAPIAVLYRVLRR